MAEEGNVQDGEEGFEAQTATTDREAYINIRKKIDLPN